MIDLNVRALTELSLAFVESLARHRGGILNGASVASFMPGPGLAVYYASKAYVLLSFSEALQQELSHRDVRVTAPCPGPVPTEFQTRVSDPRRATRRTDAERAVVASGRLRRPYRLCRFCPRQAGRRCWNSVTKSGYFCRASCRMPCCCRLRIGQPAGRRTGHSGSAPRRLEITRGRDTTLGRRYDF